MLVWGKYTTLTPIKSIGSTVTWGKEKRRIDLMPPVGKFQYPSSLDFVGLYLRNGCE
jgi:hypothetical protein